MRSVHVRLLFLALGIGSFVTGAALAGCGGGDSSSSDQDSGAGDGSSVDSGGGGGDDGGGGGSDGGGGGDSSSASAVANDVTVYLGQVAQLDASGSAPPGATIAWTVSNVPGGSAITTGSLLNANAAKASFTPDVLGDYALKLTVTAGTASDSKTVTVHAVSAQVFYSHYQYQESDGAPLDGSVYDFFFVPSTGGSPTSVVCPVQQRATASAYTVERGSYVGEGVDWWEGPPGSEARAIVAVYNDLPDGGIGSLLYSTTSGTTCTGAKKPVLLDTIVPAASIVAGQFSVRISPDGNRVLFVKNLPSDGTSFLTTMAFDGSAAHTHIAPIAAYPDGGALDASANTSAVPARWISTSKIAWGHTESGRWEIVTANDADNATPSLAMACNGSLSAFEILPNGDFVVEAKLPFSDGGVSSAQDIAVLHPNATTKECEVVHNLTQLSNATSSVARGIALSPDKTRVAFIAADSTIDAGGASNPYALYTAPVDGSAPSARVPGVPFGAGGTVIGRHGPRWIAGGTALSWEQDQNSFDAGDGAVAARASIVSGPAGGGGFTQLARSEQGTYVFSIPNSACSISHGGGSALMAFGSLAAFIGLVVRRRRRDHDEG